MCPQLSVIDKVSLRYRSWIASAVYESLVMYFVPVYAVMYADHPAGADGQCPAPSAPAVCLLCVLGSWCNAVLALLSRRADVSSAGVLVVCR